MIDFKYGKFAISIDFEAKRVTSLTHDGKELIFGNVPFFLVKLRNHDNSTKYISAFETNLQKIEENAAFYSCDYFDVVLYINFDMENVIWKIDVKNKSDLLIEQVEIMSIGLCPKLKDEIDGYGTILTTYNEGAIVSNLQRRMNSPFGYMEPEYPSLSKYFIFPNMLSSQFEAYVDENYGIYFGMHDKDRTPKHIDFNYSENHDALKIQLRTFTNTNYGEDYHMSFDCVMSLFEGNYYDACEIYRNWFEANKIEGLLKIKERCDLPTWYKESPVIVTYPIRGVNDADPELKLSKLYPYNNVIPVLNDFKNKTNSKMMALMMQWEAKAPWTPPYSWQPYGGAPLFAQFVHNAHEQDILVGLYASGFGYTVKSLKTDYNMVEEFNTKNLKNSMCSNSNNDIKSTIVDVIRYGFDMCPSTEFCKTVFKAEMEKIINSGVDYCQALDQNHGGAPYFCYSEHHGHVPAPGKWQNEETIKILKSINRKNALLGCESAASEPYINELMLSDNRYILNYYIGVPFPLYSYLYHEYVNNFMGNQICMVLFEPNSIFLRLAYSFIAGDLLTLVINENADIMTAWCSFIKVDKEKTLKFIKRLNEWRKVRSDLLIEGKNVKPIDFLVKKEKFLHEDGTYLTFDSVLTSAFDNGVFKGQLLVNYTLDDQVIEFNEPKEVYLEPTLSNSIKDIKTLRIPPLKCYMIKI